MSVNVSGSVHWPIPTETSLTSLAQVSFSKKKKKSLSLRFSMSGWQAE